VEIAKIDERPGDGFLAILPRLRYSHTFQKLQSLASVAGNASRVCVLEPPLEQPVRKMIDVAQITGCTFWSTRLSTHPATRLYPEFSY